MKPKRELIYDFTTKTDDSWDMVVITKDNKEHRIRYAVVGGYHCERNKYYPFEETLDCKLRANFQKPTQEIYDIVRRVMLAK